MNRWACVDLAALPLQLVLRQQPDWRGHPTAVVAEDKPQGTVMWVNRCAHAARIRTGMRYAEALSLVPTLRAGVVSEGELAAAVTEITELLRQFSPAVEASGWRGEPGVFWLDASGFERLQPSLLDWAQQIERALREATLQSTVVVGFDRFSTYALARQLSFGAAANSAKAAGSRAAGSKAAGSKAAGSTAKGTSGYAIAFESVAEERRRSDTVSLDLLDLDPRFRDRLAQLGIDDVAGVRRLPAGALMERFGKESFELRRLMTGDQRAPLSPVAQVEAVRDEFEVDPEQPQVDRQALLFLVKQSLGELEQQLRRRGEVFAALQLRCELDDGHPEHVERIEPAAPTLDAVQLTDLVRLRLEPVTFPAPLVGFELTAETTAPERQQGELFAERSRRDLAAANRALARLRAEFGESAVQHAALHDGHLPEARFVWRELRRLVRLPVVDDVRERSAAASRDAAGSRDGDGYGSSWQGMVVGERAADREDVGAGGPQLVRRLLREPMPLSSAKDPTDGWYLGGLSGGPVQQLWGPFTISGGWWRRTQHRDYYFVETRRGDLLWVYHDRTRRRWFLHGVVE